eukprot:TRINITY_DN7328_c0_g1_i2.p1 TRINITY_DN7328_c0_g1~~TRINITY_DN7328_c0_g1_i2.p1  ORF type:complete len:550 (+),score=215.38 TRINITY_DN7328_c0_g1_i2:118-1767(+)
MGGGERGADGDRGKKEEDFAEFLEIRRHVKRLQTGTPLLLRLPTQSGQENLQIVHLWLSQDLQTLLWNQHDDDKADSAESARQQVPLTAVSQVIEEEDTSNDDDEDGHYALSLVIRPTKGCPSSLGLVLASPEDLAAWRDGLRFLLTAAEKATAALQVPSPTPSPSGKSSGSLANGRPPASPAAAAAVAARRDQVLEEKVAEQEKLIAALKQENTLLNDVVKRKDATIATLMRNAEQQEKCSKTELTSRESDDHLRDREVAMLKRKNKRLQKELQAKKATVSELLQTLSRLNANYESSAVEDDDAEEDDSEAEESQSPADAKGAVASTSPSAASKARKEAVSAVTQDAMRANAAGAQAEEQDDEDDDEEGLEGGIEGLVEKLAFLEQAVAGLGSRAESAMSAAAQPKFAPPPRGGGAAAAAAAAGGGGGGPSASEAAGLLESLQQLQAMQAALGQFADAARSQADENDAAEQAKQPVPNARAQAAIAAMRGFQAPAPAATAGLGARSAAALEALEKEQEKLEEKKRVVQRLSRQLEPPSDDEDDGFPLR